MSDVEARVIDTLPSPDGGPFLLHGPVRRGAPAAAWIGRYRNFTPGLLAGDIACGALAIAVATVIANVAGLGDQIDLAVQLRVQAPVTLALLIGTCCLLGLYRSSARSPMERFRLRTTAT